MSSLCWIKHKKTSKGVANHFAPPTSPREEKESRWEKFKSTWSRNEQHLAFSSHTADRDSLKITKTDKLTKLRNDINIFYLFFCHYGSALFTWGQCLPCNCLVCCPRLGKCTSVCVDVLEPRSSLFSKLIFQSICWFRVSFKVNHACLYMTSCVSELRQSFSSSLKSF